MFTGMHKLRGLAAVLGIAVAVAAGSSGEAAEQSITVRLDAVLASGGAPIEDSLDLAIWKVEGAGAPAVIAERDAAPAEVKLDPGRYRVVAEYRTARTVQDILVADQGAQRHVINLKAGEIELSLLPELRAEPIAGPLEWEIRRYARGSKAGRKIAAIRGGHPQLLLSEGWYEVQVKHDGEAIEHLIEVAAGQRYDYTLVMNR